jgi:hypothetical protein
VNFQHAIQWLILRDKYILKKGKYFSALVALLKTCCYLQFFKYVVSDFSAA